MQQRVTMGESTDLLQMILLTACLGFAAYYALVHGYLKPIGLSLPEQSGSLQQVYGSSYNGGAAAPPEEEVYEASASPLPAPVFGNAIAEDTETLEEAYGSDLQRARDAAAAAVPVEGKMPLPMVAESYSAAPLAALGGYAAAQQQDAAASCASSCASKSTPILQNNCKRACHKSLGVQISSYNNKVDFLRLLPGQA